MLLLLLACADRTQAPGGELPSRGASTWVGIEIAPFSVDFGDVPIGGTATATVDVTSVGTGTLVFEARVEDADRGFTVGVESLPIPPGETYALPLSFSPVSRTDAQTRLLLTSEDPETPQVAVPLSGAATWWDLVPEAATVDFGELGEGCTVDERVSFEAIGNADPFTLLGFAGGDPAIAGDLYGAALPADVAPRDTIVVTVAATGAAVGPLDATLSAVSPETSVEILRVRAEVVEREVETFTYTVPSPGSEDIVVVLDVAADSADYTRARSNLDALFEELAWDDRRFAIVVGEDGCVPGRWVDASTTDPEAAFEAMFAVAGGDSTGQGFMLLEAATTSTNLGAGGCNEGLIRDASPLAVVFVSDTFDQSANAWSYYVSLVQSLKTDADDLVIHAVAPDYPSGCNELEPGQGWYEASVATGGLYLSICATDWASHLLDAFDSPAWGGSIEVPDWPEPDSIQVLVDDLPASHWIYNETDNSLDFEADHVPPPGSVVTITYYRDC